MSEDYIVGAVITVFAVIMCAYFLVVILEWLTKASYWSRSFIKRFITTVGTCLMVIPHTLGLVRMILFFVFRGRLTVRASTYLMMLSHPDATPESANKLALSIDTYAAKELLPGTMYHLNEMFNGSRLALISEARLRGFLG